MAESYGFFNSATGDERKYRADQFAEFFSIFLNSGIASVNSNVGLKIKPDTGLKINMDTGFALINGYYYKNDSQRAFNIEASDSTLNRIDRAILKLDLAARTITVYIKKGNLASSPAAPSLQRDSSIYELSLAQIVVNARSTAVTVVDERMDKTVCGLISVAANVPVQEMWDIFNSQWAKIQEQWEQWFNNKQNLVNPKIFQGNSIPSGAIAGDIWICYI